MCARALLSACGINLKKGNMENRNSMPSHDRQNIMVSLGDSLYPEEWDLQLPS